MKTLLAAILGGMLVFAWNGVSWVVLKWHEPTVRTLMDEAQVAQVLVDNAPVSGIYVLPNQMAANPPGTDALEPAPDNTDSASPFAFIAFSREGMPTQMNRQYAYALISSILTALLIVILVRAADVLGYFMRVLFITTIGVVIALGGRLQNWIWWHFPADFMQLDCADIVIGWFIAALVMAALTGAEKNRLGPSYRRVRM